MEKLIVLDLKDKFCELFYDYKFDDILILSNLPISQFCTLKLDL